jgi:hypothetical protein
MRRWRDWNPTETRAVPVPTKPTEPYIEGFEGSLAVDVPKERLTLANLPPDAKGIPWAEWERQQLDQQFKEYRRLLQFDRERHPQRPVAGKRSD